MSPDLRKTYNFFQLNCGVKFQNSQKQQLSSPSAKEKCKQSHISCKAFLDEKSNYFFKERSSRFSDVHFRLYYKYMAKDLPFSPNKNNIYNVLFIMSKFFCFILGSIYRRGARRWRKLYRINGHIFQAKRFNRVSFFSVR
jgi:hypothetical protein